MADSIDLKELKREFPNTVILRLIGKFYTAFDDSAYALSEITNYKVRRKGAYGMDRCAFPIEALDKVIKLLDAAEVSYLVLQKENVVISKSYENENFDSLIERKKGLKDYSCDDSFTYQSEKTKVSDKELNNDYLDILKTDLADNSINLTFKCSNENFEKLKNLYGKYSSWVFNPVSFDFFMNLLLSAAVERFKD